MIGPPVQEQITVSYRVTTIYILVRWYVGPSKLASQKNNTFDRQIRLFAHTGARLQIEIVQYMEQT